MPGLGSGSRQNTSAQAKERNRQALQRKMELELELELIQTQMTQKPMLRTKVGMRVRCANSAKWLSRSQGFILPSRRH